MYQHLEITDEKISDTGRIDSIPQELESALSLSLTTEKLLSCLKKENLVLASRQLTDHTVRLNTFRTKWDAASEGDTLLLYRGVSFDPHSKSREIIARKPALLIVEDLAPFADCDIPLIQVTNGRSAWSTIMNAFYDHPTRQMNLIGVTGTNGKTSTVWFVKQILENLGRKVCSIGTLGAFIGEEFWPTSHTTPDPDALFELFAKAKTKGCEFVVMETSSHAIFQEKLRPLRFQSAVFTNFTQDHLDLHGSMEEYFACKARLFSELSTEDTFKLIHSSLKNKIDGPVEYYGPSDGMTFTTRTIEGTKFLLSMFGESREIETNIVGSYFCENLAAAILVVRNATGQWPNAKILKNIPPVPGRLERVSDPHKGPHVFVDYAHTPDAIEKSCDELKSLSSLPLTIVFGCGGNRDKAKRPKMMAAAARYADRVIVTSDNPRDEDPEAIISDILSETAENTKTAKIADRKTAIFSAIQSSVAESVVLIAGKGHEDYQIIKGKSYPFDDRIVAKDALGIT